MQGLVSIITPSFNSEKFIADTIRSVQSQTYVDWEMIIVDDCSSDATSQIVQQIASTDTRIKFYQLQKNAGAGVARQQAIEMAQGRWIAFLDSDDLWKPEKLQKQIEFMQSRNLPFTFSFYDCIDEAGKALNKQVRAPQKLKYYQLFFCNFVGNLTGIYDTQFFGKIPISSIRKRQDWMVWLTVLKKIRTAQTVAESLAFYRIRQDSISASKIKLLEHNFNVYRQFHGYNVFVSMLCMLGFLFVQLIIKPRYIKKLNE
ncbi:glycosyltransferase family 2 protein [Flavobacterium sp. CYK-55]|uniref:glycosyltransferase family 2 protein n=1 Tax=Flavobacterium sp. CYK-55 TaxID=2835529 RepID=UPI001BCC4AF9|nr:glycosyltransferase family 2 protein [Flavobacterium sp. CYK-55]MBS7787528.1 glycosyltransferase family 2 protein [Flavobacterium sp. CYK-55]